MKPERRLAAVWLPWIVLLLVQGCAYVPARTEPPRVHLTGIQLQQAELFEQRYLLRLRIQNPNDFALNVRGLDFRLDLNGERFADGVSNHAFEVPAYGEALAEVEVSSSLWSLARRLRDLGESGAARMEYRLHGRVALTGFGVPLAFESAGELGLPDPAR